MSEQTANGRYENGRRFRLNEIVLGVVLTAMFAFMALMFTVLFNSVQQLSNRVDALDRKVEENSRILVEMQTTLRFLVNGRIEPKEQAGPATDTPAPSEQLATKDP